jgi:hypothetical protein
VNSLWGSGPNFTNWEKAHLFCDCGHPTVVRDWLKVRKREGLRKISKVLYGLTAVQGLQDGELTLVYLKMSSNPTSLLNFMNNVK